MFLDVLVVCCFDDIFFRCIAFMFTCEVSLSLLKSAIHIKCVIIMIIKPDVGDQT